MLLDYIFVEVVVLVNNVIAWEGILQEIVSDDKEVKLELKAVVIAVLQVDVALIVLVHVVLFDAGHLRCLFSSYSLDLGLDVISKLLEDSKLCF